ncbi:uncharacterized protein Y057_9789 [Fusarium fujikuroi]|uniref:Uncharacterized protein n=1 Tax=Fusarium fujikuroi TaxID=5127 RepID=A0A2H3RT74_FUSFU|nr:uncharacterized protein Y057_9789 [Fusarium fujikuroi]SCN69944.1 uncharacterized protein FFC1_00726 [Fusarium fujikuroi]VTT57093.1 unnamed protein product [Fusarium fujikuroi]
MHASKIIASIGLAASAHATVIRYERDLEANAPAAALEKRAEPTAAWVTVDDEMQPATTYTPSYTTVDGTTSLIDAPPHDLTASVYTYTSWGKIHTSTGEPPNPQATGKHGEGVFARCYNKDGDSAPFCSPYANSTLDVKNTYFVTWDPDYFNKTKSSDNSTLLVTARLDLYNRTSEKWVKYKEFTDSAVPAAWGYWPFDVKQDYMKYSPYNISITLYSNSNNSLEKTKSSSLYLNLNDQNFPEKSHEKLPEGQTLTIALPVVFGSLFLLVVGGFLWNRKTRRIGLGNISSRSRHGYTGRAKRRIFGARDNGIQLDTSVPPPGEYRDAPQRARADSDGLGSLAGSPVDPTFPQQGTTGGRNAFRDEVRRQEEERRM